MRCWYNCTFILATLLLIFVTCWNIGRGSHSKSSTKLKFIAKDVIYSKPVKTKFIVIDESGKKFDEGIEVDDSTIKLKHGSTSKANDQILLSLRRSSCQRQMVDPETCDTVTQESSSSDSNSINDVDNKFLSNEVPLSLTNMNQDHRIPDRRHLIDKLEDRDDVHSFKSVKIAVNSNEDTNPKIDSVSTIPEHLTLPDCSNHHDESYVIIVSTLDGHVSGINYQSGVVLWSLQTGQEFGPLLSSSMSDIEVVSRGEWIKLIPSLDGGIYRFDGMNVEALPVTADTLLHSSFKYNEDTVFVGGKVAEVVGVSPITGNVIYVCNSNGCPKFSEAQSSEILVIKRVSNTVRAIDPKSGTERWNFSVGQHEINSAGGGCDSSLDEVDVTSSLPSLKFLLPKGVIFGTDVNNEMMWTQKLSSPIVSAWSFINGELVKMNLFDGANVPALLQENHFSGEETIESSVGNEPSLYVGIHKKQLYIQENMKFQKDVSSLAQRFSSGALSGDGSNFPKVLWQPYLATALSRTPVIHHAGKLKHPMLLGYSEDDHFPDLALQRSVDYPYDNGYFLYGGQESIVLNESDYWDTYNEDESEYEDDSITNHFYHICFQFGPNTWWKLLVGFGVYAICHVMFLRYLINAAIENMRRKVQERAVTFVRASLQHYFMENPQMMAVDQAPETNQIQLTALESPEDLNSSSKESFLSLRQDSNFFSRYTTDFEPISCLGRGGFGVVFQAKNKLDENEYAIKRIVLPTKESSSERVKREARALAKLNHANIVRYYNSWLETPPPGWDDDSWLYKRDATNSSCCSPYGEETEEKPLNRSGNQNVSVLESINRLYPQKKMVKLLKREEGSDDSLSGFEEDDEDEIEEEVLRGESREEAEDSIDIIFQDTSITNGDASCDDFPNGKSNLLSDDSIVIKTDISIDAITKNDFSKLTCFSFEGRKGQLRAKSRSQSLSLESSKVKVLKRRRVKSHGPLMKAERPSSLNLLSSTSDPGITMNDGRPPVRVTQSPRTYLYIQMELCQKESLKEWLFTNENRDYSRINFIFNDIVQAVEYVHDRSLMHRDLKPSNIFFSLDGQIKVGDFGLVTTIEDEDSAITPVDPPEPSFGTAAVGDNSIAAARQRTLNAGTHLYMSPEQMLVPFRTEMERSSIMLEAREMRFPEGFEEQFPSETSLLQLALHKNPNERPTTRGIRSREPLVNLQKDLSTISPEEHFNLTKVKGHSRSYSGSFAGIQSSSSSSTQLLL